jgi:hypothetical protein
MIIHNRKYCYLKQKLSSILMALLLFWLTISLPVVAEARAISDGMMGQQSQQNDLDENPFANTTEEKTVSSSDTLSEYLHESYVCHFKTSVVLVQTDGHYIPEYQACHPELILPPPKR